MNADHELLFSRICDGLATAEEISSFHGLLRTDVGFLDAWLLYSSVHGDLAAGPVLAEAVALRKSPHEKTSPLDENGDAHRLVRTRGWFSWAPQAAAGLIVGLCAASLVWAYVAPPALQTLTLLDEDFEHPELSLAVRAPLETGIWRGDAAEITEAQDGVTPAIGRKMMRFLRADYSGPLKPAGGHIAAVYRLIDLRPLRAEFADGAGVVEVSARFNAKDFSDGERYGCAISLYALDVDSVPDRAGRLGSTLSNEALAMARSSRTHLDHDPTSWQRATTEIRLPVDAQFLVVRLHISQAFESGDGPMFTGAYVDDVQVRFLSRRPSP